jgi:hypothetical protein
MQTACLSIKKAGCHLLTTGPQCRGDWIRTSDLLNPIQSGSLPNSLTEIVDASSLSAACTSACTNGEKNNRPDNIEALAAALRALSAEERARLLALLGSEGNADNAWQERR